MVRMESEKMKYDTKLLLQELKSEIKSNKNQINSLKEFIKKWCLNIPDESTYEQAKEELQNI